MTDVASYRPTARDIAYGFVLGQDPAVPLAAARSGPVPGPLVALERAVLPALRRPPCLVSFSGGLDSSLVLAIATRVARREGLPDPVPVTWRFTGAPRAEESSWQDRVIAELGLARQWQILRAGDDLDVVGPVARRLLTRYGPVHPWNRHLHLPIVELARGGALLTGVGGDRSSPAGVAGPVRCGPGWGGCGPACGSRNPSRSRGCVPRRTGRHAARSAPNCARSHAGWPRGSPGTCAAAT